MSLSDTKSKKTLKIVSAFLAGVCFLGTVIGIPLAVTFANGGNNKETSTPVVPLSGCNINELDVTTRSTVERSFRWSKFQAAPAVTYWRGYAYNYVPGDNKFEKIFLFDGFNIGSTQDAPESCDHLCWNKTSREVAAYRDPKTGQSLNVWENTMTGKINEVRPVINDPVNLVFDESYNYEYHESATNENKFLANLPIFLKYPNALANSSYDAYSGFEHYYAAEIYGTFFDGCQAIDSLADRVDYVDSLNAWSRISQYLPWMEIGTDDPNWGRGWFLTHAFSPLSSIFMTSKPIKSSFLIVLSEPIPQTVKLSHLIHLAS